MRVVKSYVREEYEKQKFDAAAADVQRGLHKSRAHPCFQQSAHAVLHVCGDGVRAVLRLLHGHHHPRALTLDVGQMSSLLTYSFQILMSLMMLSMVFVMITMASRIGAAHRGGAARGERAAQARKTLCAR